MCLLSALEKPNRGIIKEKAEKRGRKLFCKRRHHRWENKASEKNPNRRGDENAPKRAYFATVIGP